MPSTSRPTLGRRPALTPLATAAALSLVLGAAAAAPATAQPEQQAAGAQQAEPYEQIELQARTNLLVNDDGWNLPPGSSFNSITPDINDDAQIAFRVQVVTDEDDPTESSPGLWFGGGGEGSIVHTTDGSAIDNDVSINAAGEVAFTVSTGIGANTLWRLDGDSGEVTQITTPPVLPNGYQNPTLDDSGDVSFQASFSAGRALAATVDGEGTFVAQDSGLDPESPWGFVYTPRGNNSGQIAVKMGLVDDIANDVEVLRFDFDGTAAVLASSDSVDPESPYSGFDNGLGLADDGTVAVVANRAADNARVVLRLDDDGVTEVAAVGDDGLTDIHFFSPDVNADGQVVFRGDDEVGQAVFVADGESLTRVAGQGDEVETDLGTAQLGQHDTSPVFGGAPRINAAGDISFTAGVHPAGNNQVEWGSGVFVAYSGDEEPPPTEVEIDRLDGNDRYEVAVAISERLAPGVPAAVVVGGGDFADALVAAAPAGSADVPVLLTRNDHLPSVTAAELSRLQPQEVIVVGGENSVDDTVLDAIAGAAGDVAVTRVGGGDRYEVAANVAAHFEVDDGVVYVASGTVFADALTGSARAGATDTGVLLTRPDRLPLTTHAALAALDPDEIRVLGGPESVNAEVFDELGAYGTVTRIDGSDRYDVAVQLSQAYAEAETVYLASGLGWPDAVAGAALAGAVDQPLLLVKDGTDGTSPVPSVIATELLRLGPERVVLFGGTDTLPVEVVTALEDVFAD